jgi:hypothetical protein
MGTRHPPTADDTVPQGKTRVILGWLTLAFVLISFVPIPRFQPQPPPTQSAPIQQSPEDGING